MEAMGFMSTTSISAKSVFAATSNLDLASSCSPYVKSSRLSICSLKCKSRCEPGAVQAVLMEREFSASVQEALLTHHHHHHHHAATVVKQASSEFSPYVERSMRREMIPLHKLRQGDFANENPLVYRQIFAIRSYEGGPDKCTSIREIFSLFQEMALNHVHLLGIAGDGFGATRAMNRAGLIWVVTKMQVDVERYPAWPEVIEIDSWVAQAGKNGMRRDWIMRSYRTGEVLARATSTWCMMNASTRRLSKIPDEVRSEIQPNFLDDHSAYNNNNNNKSSAGPRIVKLDDATAEHHSSQLTSTPADLDVNQHVNNLKYINWVLESIPAEHVKTHKLASMVLEYRRECHSTDVVQSLTGFKTSVSDQDGDSNAESAMDSSSARQSCCQFTHLLRTQDAGQQEILRGKTTWRSRNADVSASAPC